MESTSHPSGEGRAENRPHGTRVDPPHTVQEMATAGGSGPLLDGGISLDEREHKLRTGNDAAGEEQPSAEPAAVLVRQLRTQATQLARHLDNQRKDLDYRESAINARAASFENEVRAARLWIDQQQQDLADRAAELAKREMTLAGGATLTDESAGERPTAAYSPDAEELAARRAELTTLYTELERRETALAQLADRLATQKSELETRHRELDQRQANVYQDIEEHYQQRAQMASERTELEALRSELASRQIELESARRDLNARLAQYDADRSGLNQRQSELAIEQDELAVRDAMLAERRREIETALARFERLGITERRMEEMQQETAQYWARKRYLDDAEAIIDQQQQDLAAAEMRLEHERAAHEEQVHRDGRKLAEQRRISEQELQQQREAIRRRADQLDARDASLEQLRCQIERTQRETLQLRLATEETWAQLAGAMAPASLSRSLGQVRSQLTEHYRLADEEISARKEELTTLARQVTEQHEQLNEQKRELQAWAELQQREIEQQAARLVAREQELDRQQTHYERQEIRWQEERREHQREQRKLLSKLSTVEQAAA